MNQYYVYIITNKPFGTFYIGVTNNIARRILEHKEKKIEGFLKKYGLDKLVYFEVFEDVELAIQREKLIKKMETQI